jgi:hypothetical protein
MNIPDHISETLETIFGLKYLNFLMWIRVWDPKSFLPWIWDQEGKNSDPGSTSRIRNTAFILFYLKIRTEKRLVLFRSETVMLCKSFLYFRLSTSQSEYTTRPCDGMHSGKTLASLALSTRICCCVSSVSA